MIVFLYYGDIYLGDLFIFLRALQSIKIELMHK